MSGECVSGPNGFGMEYMQYFFETLRKETGFLLEGPWECVWETCVGHWNLLKDNEYSTRVEPSPRDRGTGLCNQKCHGKSVHCSQPRNIFVLLVL